MKITSTFCYLNHAAGWFVGLLCLASASATVAQQTNDKLKQQVLAQAQGMNPTDYAFTRTIRTEQTSSGKADKKVMVEKFDPTKPDDSRWVLVSVNGTAPSADALKEFRKDSTKRRVVPGYARLALYFGSPATASTDANGRTVFRFATLPKEAVKLFDTDVSQNAMAEAAVNTTNQQPFVEQVHITVRPMRLKLIMKLEKYESTARYQMGPEGKPLLMEQISDMLGSGLGQEGRAHTVTTYSDYRVVSKQR